MGMVTVVNNDPLYKEEDKDESGWARQFSSHVEKLIKKVDLTLTLDHNDYKTDGLFVSVDKMFDSLRNAFGMDGIKYHKGRAAIEFIPLIANISSGDDVSKRYYYNGECTGSTVDGLGDCTSITVKDLPIRAPFAAKFIFLINDRRPQYVEKSMSKVSVKVNVEESKSEEGAGASSGDQNRRQRRLATSQVNTFELAQYETWNKVYNEEAATGGGPIESSQNVGDTMGTVAKYTVYVMIANYIACITLFAVLALLQVRWCTKCMGKKVKTNEIIKKFEGTGARHLQAGEDGLDGTDRENLEEIIEEQKALLAMDESKQS